MVAAAAARLQRPGARGSRTSLWQLDNINALWLLANDAAGCTVGALALGRFVFLPYHRASLAKAGMPKQNDQTHFEAGDIRAEEASFVLKTNDPAGEQPDA